MCRGTDHPLWQNNGALMCILVLRERKWKIGNTVLVHLEHSEHRWKVTCEMVPFGHEQDVLKECDT